MLWPILLLGVGERAAPVACLDDATPYAFAVQLWRDGGTDRPKAIAYDLLVEDAKSGHYLQMTFLDNRLATVDGVVVRQSSIVTAAAPYSLSTTKECTTDALFGFVPIAVGKPPTLHGSTVKQDAKISVDIYSDAVVYSFDEFAKLEGIVLTEGVCVEVAASGCLAGLVFSGEIARELKARLRK